jgi:hypothetical protein
MRVKLCHKKIMEKETLLSFNAEEVLHAITDGVVSEPKDSFCLRRDELIALWNRVVRDTENGVITLTQEEVDLVRW